MNIILFSVPPKFVKITNEVIEMLAGEEYNLECTSGGSNPPANISWNLLGPGEEQFGRGSDLGTELVSANISTKVCII